MRIAPTITAQELDGEAVVIMDESTGAEITLDIPTARRLAGALHYLVPGGIGDVPLPGGGHLIVRPSGAPQGVTGTSRWEFSRGGHRDALGDHVFQSGRHRLDGTSEPGEFLPIPPRLNVAPYAEVALEALTTDVNRGQFSDRSGRWWCSATGKKGAESEHAWTCTATPGHKGDHAWPVDGLTICGGTWRGMASTDANPSYPQPCGLGLGHDGPSHGPAPRS